MKSGDLVSINYNSIMADEKISSSREGEAKASKLYFTKLSKHAHSPTKGSSFAAGFDLKRYKIEIKLNLNHINANYCLLP